MEFRGIWAPIVDVIDSSNRFFRDSGVRGKQHTVDDSTNDLVNLSGLGGLSASIASRESSEGIASEWLEGRSEGRRSREGGPSEGPGNTATNKTENC